MPLDMADKVRTMSKPVRPHYSLPIYHVMGCNWLYRQKELQIFIIRMRNMESHQIISCRDMLIQPSTLPQPLRWRQEKFQLESCLYPNTETKWALDFQVLWSSTALEKAKTPTLHPVYSRLTSEVNTIKQPASQSLTLYSSRHTKQQVAPS